MELKEIIKYVKDSCKESGIKPDDNQILEAAQKIYVSGNINSTNNNQKPTSKQIAVMNSEEFKEFFAGNTEQLSRVEASELIKEYFAKSNTGKNLL